MEMMQMTAMESLKDSNMVYLDLAAGFGGLILFNLIEKGKLSFSFSKINWNLAIAVLVSRIIVDFSYHTFISNTDFFGGSNKEFILSSLVFIALLMGVFKLDQSKTQSLYLSTALVMFAVARATHWG